MDKLEKLKKEVRKKEAELNYRALKKLSKSELKDLDSSIDNGNSLIISAKTKLAESCDLEVKKFKDKWIVIDSNYMSGKFKSLKALIREFKRTSL